MTNQEIAAVTARQKAWSKVREIIKTKIESPSKSGLDGAEHKRLTCQLEAVGVLWYPMANLDEMTPEEALPLAQEAVREHAPELCDVIGIGWPVEIGALITEPRPAAALHEAAPKPNKAVSEPYFLHIVSDPGPHQPLAVLLAEHETSGINASGFIDLADIEEIYPMRNGQAQIVANGTDLILSAASATQVCNSLDVNVGERFAWRLKAAEAKAKAAEGLLASANAAMQYLAGLCDCKAGSGCDRARIREQLRAALAVARAAGIGSDDNRVEASQ